MLRGGGNLDRKSVQNRFLVVVVRQLNVFVYYNMLLRIVIYLFVLVIAVDDIRTNTRVLPPYIIYMISKNRVPLVQYIDVPLNDDESRGV